MRNDQLDRFGRLKDLRARLYYSVTLIAKKGDTLPGRIESAYLQVLADVRKVPSGMEDFSALQWDLKEFVADRQDHLHDSRPFAQEAARATDLHRRLVAMFRVVDSEWRLEDRPRKK